VNTTKLNVTIYCRIDRNLKRKLAAEVRSQRLKGHGSRESDVTREALVEYFERRQAHRNGKAVAA
jgi:hypothetical protein